MKRILKSDLNLLVRLPSLNRAHACRSRLLATIVTNSGSMCSRRVINAFRSAAPGMVVKTPSCTATVPGLESADSEVEAASFWVEAASFWVEAASFWVEAASFGVEAASFGVCWVVVAILDVCSNQFNGCEIL